MNRLALAGWVSFLCCSALAEPEIKGTATELAQYLKDVPKTVVVTGEAEVRVPAHRAVMSLRVITENRSLQEALRLNRDLRNKIAERLKKDGIAADRIQASKFSSTPKFGIFSEKAKSYRVENVLRITVQDDKEFQSAAEAVDSSSDVQFSGVEFEYADKEALKQKALSQACDNAGDRRKLYEEKLGVKLIAVSFDEGAVAGQNAASGNYGIRVLGSAVRSYDSAQPTAIAGTAPALAAEESVSSFGELVYSARVGVTYSVQPK